MGDQRSVFDPAGQCTEIGKNSKGGRITWLFFSATKEVIPLGIIKADKVLRTGGSRPRGTFPRGLLVSADERPLSGRTDAEGRHRAADFFLVIPGVGDTGVASGT